MKNEWYFMQLRPNDRAGESAVAKNFNRESKSATSIFFKEYIQNVLDARCDDPSKKGQKLPAHIAVSLKELSAIDELYLEKITNPLAKHLAGAGHPPKSGDWEKHPLLVIEEFGTVGLTGNTDHSQTHKESDRWNNFWFGEALPGLKGIGANGGRGQGKITYHMTSGCRSVFALTKRNGDPKNYVFGKCIVQKTHSISSGQELYDNHGFWPKTKNIGNDKQSLPETDKDFVRDFKTAFDLKRKGESGTSWVIPFVPPQITKDEIVCCFLIDFFTTIMRNRLTLDICGEIINSKNVRQLVNKYGINSPSQDFFTFMEKATNTPKSSLIDIYADGLPKNNLLDEDDIGDSRIKDIRSKFHAGDMVSIKLPLELKEYGGKIKNSFVEVHLQNPDSIKTTEELYMRYDLQISDEKHIPKSQGVFGLMVADDIPIAEFLGTCENASHTQWNEREGQIKKIYNNVRDILQKVRGSLPELCRLAVGSDNNLDEDSLSDILSAPLARPTIKPPPAPAPAPTPTPPPPPAPAPTPPTPISKEIFKYDSKNKTGSWIIVPGKDIGKIIFPFEAEFTFAYDRLHGSGDAFDQYIFWDFDLADGTHAPVKSIGINVLEQKENFLKIQILSKNFKLILPGFSTAFKLCSRSEQ